MKRTVLRGARVFDGTGRPPQGHLAVVIEDDRIAGVVAEGSLGHGIDALTVDLGGCVLLPGLIDLHVHLGFGARPARETVPDAAFRAARNVRVTQAAGITTIRDVGTANGVAIATRDAVQRGDIPGSRVVPCGQIICMTGGHGSEAPAPPGMAREADGADDCRRAVREQVRAGAECIKVTTNGPLNVVEFTPAELEAIVDEAHRCDRRVACHASILGASRMAIRAGVDTMEHGCDLDEAAVRDMAAAGIVLVPTLLVTTLIMERWDEYKAIPMMRSILVRAKRHVESFQIAMAAGVTMAAGTDIFHSLGRFDALPEELGVMVQHGMAANDALVAATRNGARALGLEHELGTVERGKRADLLAVEADPTRDIGALRRVALVVQSGQVVGGTRCS
jgi:imidazolonepropionase-like amidohydrolase